MKTANKILDYYTQDEKHFIDLTDEVIKFVKESGIKEGLVNIQTLHTTTSIIVNEKERGLKADIKGLLNKLVPKEDEYAHDDFTERNENMCDGECANGFAHLRAILMPTSVTLNLSKGKIQLGAWQRIFLIEQDRSRKRKVQIKIIGE